MSRYSPASFRRPIIVDPSKEEVEITDFTAKIFAVVLTPGNERFPFVYEQASFFYRRRADGRIEKVAKRKGKGYPGGGSKKKPDGKVETPEETAIREGNEELGTPLKTLERLIHPELCYTVFAGDTHPFHLLYVEVNEEEVAKGFLNRGAITDWKLVGRKADWARLRELNRTVFSPQDKDEREAREARGETWFYHGHQTLLVAMLIRLVKSGMIKGSQCDLPQIVFYQTSPFMCFSNRMVEILVKEGRTDLLEYRLPRIARSESLSLHALHGLVSVGEYDLAERAVRQANHRWRGKAEKLMMRLIDSRESAKADKPTVFGSLDELLEFHSSGWDVSEESWAEGDPEAGPPVYGNLDELINSITFEEE